MRKVVSVVSVVAALVVGCAGQNKPAIPSPVPPPAPSTLTNPAPPPPPTEVVKPNDIRVRSQIVKLVDGEHHYFFDIRNHGSNPFEGEVTIRLFAQNPEYASERKSTFVTTRPMEPGRGRYVSTELSTGPPSVHGEFGMATFTFEATSNGHVISKGSGAISDAYEDLSP